MDTDLKCNRLNCRRALNDKAVVTTCSHLFCVDCANELFGAARLCPACETSLTEPDDVVVCSLHPTNDYKTSVLSGLNPSTILEICSRAVSFWQYQIHQENSFQQAVLRNLNDKIAVLQKQLDNVVREANGEINLLSNKVLELERDAEIERRKIRDMQDAAKERDKEYQKLKGQYDKIKRKALLGPNGAGPSLNLEGAVLDATSNDQTQRNITRPASMQLGRGNVDMGAVISGMEATGIQRTPIAVRTNANFGGAIGGGGSWPGPGATSDRTTFQRQQFNAPGHGHGHGANADRSFKSRTVSERSDSVNEVDNMLGGGGGGGGGGSNRDRTQLRAHPDRGAWVANSSSSGHTSVGHGHNQTSRPTQRMFAPSSTTGRRTGGGFKPAGIHTPR